MGYKYSDKSKINLSTCHSDFREIFNELIKHRDASILCGHRSESEQNLAFLNGRSKVKWPDSKHNEYLSDAIDAVPYPLKWPDKKKVLDNPTEENIDEYIRDMGAFYEFAGFVLGIAAIKGKKIEWGGHFKSFFDGPHFQRKI